MRTEQNQSQIFGIDFLRFFAAFLVMIYHLSFVSWASPYNRGLPSANILQGYEPLAPFVGTGWIGVPIFFVISGFVIAYTADGSSPMRFLKRRITRLGPGVWVCASLSVPLLLMSGVGLTEVFKEFMASVLFVPLVKHVASSYWTLPVEIVFYSLIFILLCRNGFRHVEWLALIVGGGSAFMWVVYWLRSLIKLDWLGRIAGALGDRPFSRILLVQHGVFFSLGLLIWLISSFGWRTRWMVAAGVFLGAGVLEIVAETANSSRWTGYHQSPGLPIAILLLAIAGISASIAFRGAIGRTCCRHANTIRTIGLMTYPLYLIHQPFGELVLLRLLEAGCPLAPALVAAILLTVGLAAVVAVWLEPPLQAVTKQMLRALGQHLPRAFDRYRLPTARYQPAPGSEEKWRAKALGG